MTAGQEKVHQLQQDSDTSLRYRDHRPDNDTLTPSSLLGPVDHFSGGQTNYQLFDAIEEVNEED